MLDFKLKLAELKAKISKLNIGFIREEKKILIQALDKSTHTHYHNEIGLSEEAILSLPSNEIGDFLKHKTLLNVKAALKDRPEEMQKYLAMYNCTAFITGATSVTATAITMTPMPSGDFVKQIPNVIDKDIKFDIKYPDKIVWNYKENDSKKSE